ncbi:MAG TPA: hypothetical protein VJN18_07875 [Polyangiaceae bacterium]|nr:hypothetical protein [Polyangiaceae bacterium]
MRLVEDLGLSLFEDRLSEAWGKCLDDNPANAGDGFRVMTAFYRVVKAAAEAESADVTLIDVGPNVGAMNRAALVAAEGEHLAGWCFPSDTRCAVFLELGTEN